MTEGGNFKITTFNKDHAHKIALFQIITAKELENLDMSLELVTKAVQYLQIHPQFGFFLVMLKDQQTMGSLLLTFENAHSWWIQSVYVQKQYRRQGHFKQLFYETCKIAKLRKIRTLKLYANDQNIRAISAYKKLGMHMTGQKFYSFDFVYGKIKLEDIRKNLQKGNFSVKNLQKQDSQKLEDFQDLLKKKSSQNSTVGVYLGQKLIAKASYFTQFSQWRFGLTYYIDSLQVHESVKSQQIQQIHKQLCSYFQNLKQLKMCVLRYIVNPESQNFPSILKNGQLEHYVVMQMNF